MKNDKRRQIKEIFNAARRQNADECRKFLDRVCADDDSLRREVESLLSSSGDAAAEGSPQAPIPPAPKNNQLTNSQIFNHYQIIRLLGAGGMGEVYLATDTHLKRQVALELLPAELTANREHSKRFE